MSLKFSIKYTVIAIICMLLFGFKKHPFYIGVVDLKQNKQQLQVSVRLFISDLETALKKETSEKMDLIHPTKKAFIDTLLAHYIKQHLSINVNALYKPMRYIGYEINDESVWAYLETTQKKNIKTVCVNTTLLYQSFPNQTIIIHTQTNTINQSKKVTNPTSNVCF